MIRSADSAGSIVLTNFFEAEKLLLWSQQNGTLVRFCLINKFPGTIRMINKHENRESIDDHAIRSQLISNN